MHSANQYTREHLYRRHQLPIQCNRCCATFGNESTLREHQRDIRGCEVTQNLPLEGFDKDQENQLKSKKRSPNSATGSEEDRWRAVYRILFPDDDEADVPSPCKPHVHPGQLLKLCRSNIDRCRIPTIYLGRVLQLCAIPRIFQARTTAPGPTHPRGSGGRRSAAAGRKTQRAPRRHRRIALL